MVVTFTETNTSTDGANITVLISQLQQDVRKEGYINDLSKTSKGQ